MSESESLFSALEERMDRCGPPWGNSKLLASKVEDGYEAAYAVLAIAERLEAALRGIAEMPEPMNNKGAAQAQCRWLKNAAMEALDV